jgi:PTH1 family peptidyl-tRNA hydrolase
VQALQFYKAEICDLLVICDDIAIPVGALRLRLRGSDGGHNGLGSIIYELGTTEFARMRCGVGSNFRKGEQVRYVLSRYGSDELPLIRQMIDQAAIGCFSIVEQGLEKAMNSVNCTPEIKQKVDSQKTDGTIAAASSLPG